MGPIQSSINHLVGTAWGTIASAAVGIKKFGKGFNKPQASEPQTEQPKAQTSSGMGNIVKIGRLPRNKYAKAVSVMSANNLIDEKAASKTFNVADRIAAATSLSVKEGGKK